MSDRAPRKSYKFFLLKGSKLDNFIQSAIIQADVAEATFLREALIKHATDVLGVAEPDFNVVVRHARR